MNKEQEEAHLVRIIRGLTLFFIIALILSGITAFPLETEMKLGCAILGIDTNLPPSEYQGLLHWISLVYQGLSETNQAYPFLAYGFDWLAFAHLVIAVAFIGVWLKPVRNIWIVHFGMIACIGVIPLAFICGPIRGIPFYWTLIDCSFGVFGIIPLWYLHKYIKRLEVLMGYTPRKY